MTDIDRETFEQNRGRPAWVRRHREELQELTGLEIPGPLPAVADWLDGHQAHLTRHMREHFESEPDEMDSTESTDGGDA